MVKEIDLEPLRQAIREHNMMSIWRESVFSEFDSPEDYANKKAIESKDKYQKIMSSSKNDGSNEYLKWAINISLNLKITRGNSAQAIGGRHWLSWGGKTEKRCKTANNK